MTDAKPDIVVVLREKAVGSTDLADSKVWNQDAEIFTEAAETIEHLREVVERLPKTADGVPVLWGDRVYWNRPGRDTLRVVVGEARPAADDRADWRFHIPGECINAYDFECFSTEQAARAAREGWST